MGQPEPLLIIHKINILNSNFLQHDTGFGGTGNGIKLPGFPTGSGGRKAGSAQPGLVTRELNELDENLNLFEDDSSHKGIIQNTVLPTR